MKLMKHGALAGMLSLLVIATVFSPKSVFCAQSTLHIGWSEGPQAGMNPFLARSEGDYLFLGLIYEPLAMPYMDGSVKPWIAKSWTYDASAMTWTFELDSRARWSDGKPITANDVKFTFETAYQYKFPLGSPTQGFVESISTRGDYTVIFKMKKPFAAFLPLAGGTLIMPEHIWSNVGKIDLYKNTNPVGSGPYLYKQFQPRSHILLTKNANYWKSDIKVDRVIIRIYQNLEAEVVALKKGELDVMPDLGGSESLIPVLLKDGQVNTLIEKWPHILYLAPNHRIPPIGNKQFRKAIDIALDKELILKTALAGYGELPLMGYVPPLVTKWANTDVSWRGLNMTGEQRIQEANAILDNLRYKRGDDDVRVTPDGKRLAFTVRCITYPSYIRTAGIVKDNLKKIGIEMDVKVSDPETLYGGLVYSGKRPNGWEFMVHGSTMQPDPDHFAKEFAPDPPNPWDNSVAFGWVNQEIQSLLQQSRAEMDEGKRQDMIQKVQKLFADELPVITLGHRFHLSAHRTDKFTGWNPAKIVYGGMNFPLGSIVNIISLSPR